MASCLIECTFDGKWVLQESKKNVLPVEVLVSDLLTGFGDEKSVTVLKKNYTGCRLVVSLPGGDPHNLEQEIHRILRQHWADDEAEKACTCSLQPLSPEEADRLLGAEKQEAARKTEKKGKRAAASDIPVEKEERAEKAMDGENLPARRSKKSAPAASSALDAIQGLVGAAALKELAAELHAIAPQIQRTGARRAFQFQHYLFAVNDGCGLTTALERLADLTAELGLFAFPAKKRVMEWSLEPPAGDEAEPLQKLADFLRSRNHFKGVLCVDISHWIPKVRDPKFQRMLRVMAEAREDNVFVFRVPYIQPDVLETVRAGLSDVVFTRSVPFIPFSNEEYGECLRRLLADCHFTLADDAWPLFEQRLAEEKSGTRFYGLDSIDKLANEMIYRKLLANAAAQSDDTRIAAADLDGFTREPAAESGVAQLDEMVGMEHIRDRILEMVAQVQTQKELAESGRFPERPCLHMRFVGSPGTGKTTVARIVGRILKEKGILEIGNFYEVSGRSLCGRYVGETAPKTSEICRSAYGSVLFIDESYSLYAGDDNSRDYGKEAIDTLIAEMENNRDKMVVIMSGYPDEMEVLMKANPGLAGRMPYEIHFPNYSREQLTRIFLNMAGKAFDFDEPFREAAASFFGSVSDAQYKAKNFSNARLARNLYERVWAKASVRHQLNRGEPIRLLPEDLRSAVADKEFQQLLHAKGTSIGFTAVLDAPK